MTDLTENKDTRIALESIISILSRSPYDPLPSSQLASNLMGAFHNAVQTATLETQEPSPPLTPVREPWKEVFWSEVATVARTLLAEQDLDDRTFTMQEWLVLRVLTISGTCHPPHPSSLSLFVIVRRVFVTTSLCCLYEASTSPKSSYLTYFHRNTKLIHIYPNYSTASPGPSTGIFRPPRVFGDPYYGSSGAPAPDPRSTE